MSYKAHTFVAAVITIGLGVGHVSPLSAAVLSYEQTASGRTGSGQAMLLLAGLGILGGALRRRSAQPAQA